MVDQLPLFLDRKVSKVHCMDLEGALEMRESLPRWLAEKLPGKDVFPCEIAPTFFFNFHKVGVKYNIFGVVEELLGAALTPRANSPPLPSHYQKSNSSLHFSLPSSSLALFSPFFLIFLKENLNNFPEKIITRKFPFFLLVFSSLEIRSFKILGLFFPPEGWLKLVIPRNAEGIEITAFRAGSRAAPTVKHARNLHSKPQSLYRLLYR